MKTYLDCIPCFMNQALRAGRLATDDEKIIKQLLDVTGDMTKNIPMDATPAENGEIIYREIREITGVFDLYKKIKQESIADAKALYPELKEKIKNSKKPLETAVRIAIAGNVIDFGIDKKFDLKSDLEKILVQDFAIFDFEQFSKALENANYVLYLGDNAGESVFDKLLIETINKKTIYAVREVPVINDVIIQDAIDSGLDEVAEIISSGSPAPGTLLHKCNPEFIDLYNKADVVISKGQGNYEGLSDASRSIFFLLKAKCQVIARNLKVPVGSIILKEHLRLNEKTIYLSNEVSDF
jgi:damage-control phosphatase, subfamily I